MTAPTEQPIATRFFSGVPSMGCQCATSCRCGSLMPISSGLGCRRVNVRRCWLPTVSRCQWCLLLWVMEAVVIGPRWMTGRFYDRHPGFARRPQDQPPARGRRLPHAPAAADQRLLDAQWCAGKRRAAPRLRSWLSAVAQTHLEESNSAHQRVKHWHVLAFPDTTWGECGDSSNEGIRCAVDLTALKRKPFG